MSQVIMQKRIQSFSGKMQTILVPLTLILIIAFPLADTSVKREKDTIHEFYSVVNKSFFEGIPDSNKIYALSPFISASFTQELYAAYCKELEYYKSSTEPVPPLIEGSLFCSNFTGFNRIVSILKDSLNEYTFFVNFNYYEDKGTEEKRDTIMWSDKAVMKKDKKRWVIDDIILLNNSDFGLRGSVRMILTEINKMNFKQIIK